MHGEDGDREGRSGGIVGAQPRLAILRGRSIHKETHPNERVLERSV